MDLFINFIQPTNGNWLVSIVMWIIGLCSSVGFGIILFTLFLKLITLPFDLISRIQMRKNNIIMEQMRPELEKLQKQYANDKQLYNQKMMALYKKNGYSMFGACLPTILTLVIFIFAINAFTNYSKYQNKKDFYDMSVAYNRVIYSGLAVDNDYVKYEEKEGKLVFDSQRIVTEHKNEIISGDITYTLRFDYKDGLDFYEISANKNSFLSCQQFFTNNNGVVKPTSANYRLNYENFKKACAESKDGSVIKSAFNNYLLYNYDSKTGEGISLEQYLENHKEDKKADGTLLTEEEKIMNFINGIGGNKSAEKFKEVQSPFLWVKNIWVVDSPMSHPVETDWDSFKNNQGYNEPTGTSGGMNKEKYNLLTADLQSEKTQANGYFILVILTAGMAFLSQFIMSKTQKASMDLQTVDGQGNQTQKILMWMMPIMMAFFSFMYTAAFSIYMILSQVITIIFTLVSNFIIDKTFKKKIVQKESETIRGRVYVPKEEPKTEETKKGKNKPEEPDFINGGKPHIRGRLK